MNFFELTRHSRNIDKSDNIYIQAHFLLNKNANFKGGNDRNKLVIKGNKFNVLYMGVGSGGENYGPILVSNNEEVPTLKEPMKRG